MPSSINTELLLQLLERQQAMEKALGIGVKKAVTGKAPKVGSKEWVIMWRERKEFNKKIKLNQK